MECNEEIMFEPRLQEYMNKKIYYKKNNITPCIPLEVEYAITGNDMAKIKNYYHAPKKSEPYVQPDHFEPKIMYKQRVYDESLRKCQQEQLKHNPSTQSIENKLNKHREQPVFLAGHIDLPKSKRNYNANECVDTLQKRYEVDKQINFKNERDLGDILDDMQLGMPYRTTKSYGFDNPFEHYYDYIDEDIQDPTHVVLPFPRGGVSVRGENRSQRKRYEREIM